MDLESFLRRMCVLRTGLYYKNRFISYNTLILRNYFAAYNIAANRNGITAYNMLILWNYFAAYNITANRNGFAAYIMLIIVYADNIFADNSMTDNNTTDIMHMIV